VSENSVLTRIFGLKGTEKTLHIEGLYNFVFYANVISIIISMKMIKAGYGECMGNLRNVY
jgi:hypothetical protein